MQATSATFAPYVDSRHCDMRVSFRLVDTAAAGDATPSATGYDTAISQIAQTHDSTERMSAKWATLETDGWPLDGSRVIMPDSVGGLDTGWWSEVSGADGTFSTPPTLTFNFLANHSSIGFTLFFDDQINQYPDEMTVTAYDASDAVIDSETLTVTSVKQVINLPVTDYRKVVFSFASTQKAYQSVRVAEVVFGVVQDFDKNNMTGGEILYEVSPTSANQPTNELTITIDNTDRKYNLLSPNSLYAYLQQSQPLDVEVGVGNAADNIEYVNMGRFFFAKAEAQDSAMTAQIVAYDLFYWLDKSICRIGVTGTWTVSAAVAAVIADSGMTITTSIPAAIGARTINKCIPANATHREALRLIAQAAMCSCYISRDNVLTFADIAVGTPADTLDNDNMKSVAKITVSDRINTVELTVKDEYADTETIYTAQDLETGETAQVWSVDNPLAYDGNAVAAWLLAKAQMRRVYELSERGNPAREIADTATTYDAYDVNGAAVITKEQYTFNGGLSCNTKAVS